MGLRVSNGVRDGAKASLLKYSYRSKERSMTSQTCDVRDVSREPNLVQRFSRSE